MRFFAVLAVMMSLFVFAAPAAEAQTNGLVYSEDTIFTVRDDVVEVETTAVMSNTTSERRSGNTVYYSYFDSLIIVVPTNAQDLIIESRGSELSSTASEIDGDFDVRTATLPTELRSGDRRTFTITYSLPRGQIRGDGLFFSNPAFHSFPLWSFSDAGTGSLTLRVPENAHLSEFGDLLRRTGLNDGYIEWEPLDFTIPEDVFTFVTVTIDDRLDTQRFTVADQEIELRTWPGDQEWSNFAKQTITDGLPQLEELIGLPVPEQSVLEVTESVNPYFYGYAGWYDPLDTSIEIGNELDTAVMIHELSHAWFNNSLFSERWMLEGLAEEFAWQAQTALGWESEEVPGTPDTAARNAGPLIEWSRTTAAGIDDADFRARELYGYETSWFVVRELVEIIGLDGVRFVIQAANDDLVAYPGSNSGEITSVRDDWRRVLDLASVEIGADQEAELEALFVDYVVAPRHIEMIENRRVARDRYDKMIESSPGWAVPVDIRREMGRWKFDDATELMDRASEVHLRYVEVLEMAEEADLDLSDAAQISYERNGSHFGLALRVLAQQETAINAVTGVRRAATRELTTEEAWGLRDVPRAPYADLAENAFANDDRSGIGEARRRLDAKLVEAAVVGAERLFWTKVAIAALAITLVLFIWMAVRRRRNKSHVSGSPVDLAGLGDQRDPIGGYTT